MLLLRQQKFATVHGLPWSPYSGPVAGSTIAATSGLSPTAPAGKTNSAGGHSLFQSLTSAAASTTTRARSKMSFLFLSSYMPESSVGQY